MRYQLDEHISAVVPRQLKDWLIEEAEREFSTISQLLRKAITLYRRERENESRNKQNINQNSDVEQ